MLLRRSLTAVSTAVPRAPRPMPPVTLTTPPCTSRLTLDVSFMPTSPDRSCERITLAISIYSCSWTTIRDSRLCIFSRTKPRRLLMCEGSWRPFRPC
eukprot:4129925-Pleurochrysis_carterae.AAC.1